MARVDKHGPEVLFEKLSKFGPEYNYENMFQLAVERTVKERLKKETRKLKLASKKEGRLEGMREGKLKGRREGSRKAIETLQRQGIITKAQAEKSLAELEKK